MADTAHTSPRLLNGWRIAGWGALLALLTVPAIVMHFAGTDEVQWTSGDFIAAAVLLLLLGAGIELAFAMSRSWLERLALALASLAAFITLWATGAVGIIGNESLPINLAYPAIVLAGVAASVGVRFAARRMAVIVSVVAAALLATGFAAALTGTPDWGPALAVTALWAIPALLYWQAQRS